MLTQISDLSEAAYIALIKKQFTAAHAQVLRHCWKTPSQPIQSGPSCWLLAVPGLLEPWNDVKDKWQVATEEFKVRASLSEGRN